MTSLEWTTFNKTTLLQVFNNSPWKPIMTYIWSFKLPFNMLLLLTHNFFYEYIYVHQAVSSLFHITGTVRCIFKAHNWTGKRKPLTLKKLFENSVHCFWKVPLKMTVDTERIHYYCMIYLQVMISVIKLNPLLAP